MGRVEDALLHKEMRHALEQKYGKAYFSAIKKLALGDAAYDEDGYLRKEYELTDEEKSALTFIVNDSERSYGSKGR